MVNVTHILDVAEICDHPYSGCRRDSAITHTLDVPEILRPFIHWAS